MKLLNLLDSVRLLHTFSLTSFYANLSESIRCAAKPVKTMKLANKGMVQYGARDVTVGMGIVSNMTRVRTSLVIYRNIKSTRTGSDSEPTELHDVV